MYPYVMRTGLYPSGLVQCRKEVSPATLADLVSKFCVVAECDLVTDLPIYPMTLNQHTCFPVGE